MIFKYHKNFVCNTAKPLYLQDYNFINILRPDVFIRGNWVTTSAPVIICLSVINRTEIANMLQKYDSFSGNAAVPIFNETHYSRNIVLLA